ncbi:MAG: DNA/RNA non-specific endonuclease [Anaerovorax sp.]
MNRAKKIAASTLLTALLVFCGLHLDIGQIASGNTTTTLGNIPAYQGNAYIALENNEPSFSEEELTEESFEQYSDQDYLGRCGAAYANIGLDLMPTEDRGSIGQVKPTGWETIKYDLVDGKYLYNRCHLIGYQLSGENANRNNLITGTRYLNMEGMLPFENMVADYVKETGNHVLYRVTPLYDGENLLANGVVMEGYSVEDEGEGICFHVYAYNVQPGITIDYATGNSKLAEDIRVSHLNQEEESS